MVLVGCGDLGSRIQVFGGLPVVGRGHSDEQLAASHHDAKWTILRQSRAWALLAADGPAVAGVHEMHWQLHPSLRSGSPGVSVAMLSFSSEHGPGHGPLSG